METHNPNNLGYVNINPSKNQNGGAEYSYNFWLFYYLDNDKINKNLNKTDYIIIFFKGAKVKTLTYKNSNYECQETGDKKILIKNPLVKLRNDGQELLVEYNNINFPETYNNNASQLACDSLISSKSRVSPDNKSNNDKLSSNKFGIKHIDTDYYNNKFNMITIVFQENPSNEEVFNNNNANYRIYLNGELVEDRLANTNNIENADKENIFKSRVIKNNNSKLNVNPLQYDNIKYNVASSDSYINPTTDDATLPDLVTKLQPLQMADFTYFNYALSSIEINNLYKKGFNTDLANIKSQLTLSSYDYKAKYNMYPSRELSKPI